MQVQLRDRQETRTGVWDGVWGTYSSLEDGGFVQNELFQDFRGRVLGVSVVDDLVQQLVQQDEVLSYCLLAQQTTHVLYQH